MRAPRKTNSIARAVARSRHWGGSGQHWALELRKGPVANAAIRTSMSEETSDERELRQARLDLRMHGTFRRAVESETIILTGGAL